ncbi:MAG: DUF2029 domain-containing protein [Chloroflexi bacterium]|nr:DUF2029 domain-containing protein [Chloroflexota bacterium]
MRQASTLPTSFSLDALLFLLLTLPYFLQFQDSTLILIVPLLAAYLLLSCEPGLSSRRHLWKFALILLMVALTTLIPLLANIAFRLETEGTTNAFVTGGTMHDGALQTEEAVRLFLEGKNPYTEGYSNTLVAQYPMDLVAVNPALNHYVYLPFTFLLSAPFYWGFHNFLGWYDQRLVYGLGYLAVLLLVPFQAWARENRLLLWIVLGLNPLLTGHVDVGITTGVNDYLVLSLVMLTVALLHRGNRLLSAVPLALASAIKPSAWFFLPFYFVLQSDLKSGAEFPRSVRKPVLIYAVVLAIIILPFLLWDPGAFLEDNLFYTAGGSATPYPLRGLGLSTILLESGLISSRAATFPFWILELSFGGVVLVVLLRQQLKHNTIRQAWLGYSLFLGTTAFFSRFLNPNYLGYILAVLALGLWSDSSSLSTESPLAEQRRDGT